MNQHNPVMRRPRTGPSEPKQERARQTRAKILNAAAEVFRERGYPGVTLHDVADRAALTKGAVYFHYANKEALAEAVVHEHYRRWPPLVEEVRELGLSPLDSVFAIIERVASAFQEDTAVQAGARLQLERALIYADLPEPFTYWTDLLTGLAEDAVRAGQLRADVEPAAFARVLVSAFFGAQYISDVLTRRTDLAQRWAEIRTLLSAGVL